jgi:hypothetical protein
VELFRGVDILAGGLVTAIHLVHELRVGLEK